MTFVGAVDERQRESKLWQYYNFIFFFFFKLKKI